MSPPKDNNQKEEVLGSAAISGKIWPQVRGFCGGVASGVAKLVVGHPFDTVKVRLQTEGYDGRFKGPLNCLWQTVKHEKIYGLYKGATPPLIGWSVIDSVMFGVYSSMKRKFISINKQKYGYDDVYLYQCFASGFMGGMACSFVAAPIEILKNKLQVQYWDTKRQYKGPIDCIKQIYKHNGIMGFYAGLPSTLAFRAFSSVYFGSYETIKSGLEKVEMNDHLKNFLSGGCAATIFWCFSMPADVIKNRIMAQRDDIPVNERKYKGFFDCLKKVYAQDGFKGFYRGFVPCLMRSFPTNGAAFLAYELAMKYLPQ